MTCNELKIKLNQKDAELKTINEKTIEIFNLIKDDCLNTVVDKTIKYNFDYEVSLFTYQIMDFIQARLGIDFENVCFEDEFVHGVENAYLSIDYPGMGALRFRDDFESEDTFKKYLECLEKNSKDWYNARKFAETFDWSKLCVMIRSYVVSNGFNGVVATHRYTNKKCNLMEFKTTRGKLVKAQCCKNKRDESLNGESNGVYPIIAVVLTLVVIALYYLIR